MTVLQVILPLLDDAAAKDVPRLENRAVQREMLLALASKLPTAVAAWARIRAGRGGNSAKTNGLSGIAAKME